MHLPPIRHPGRLVEVAAGQARRSPSPGASGSATRPAASARRKRRWSVLLRIAKVPAAPT